MVDNEVLTADGIVPARQSVPLTDEVSMTDE